MNNWQEWRCGIPKAVLSALRLTSSGTAESNVTITWQSVPGVSYFLQRGTNGTNSSAFTILATGIPGQPGNTTFPVPMSSALARSCIAWASETDNQLSTSNGGTK